MDIRNCLFGLPLVAVKGKRPVEAGWHAAEPLIGTLPTAADGVAVRLGWGPDTSPHGGTYLFAIHAEAGHDSRPWSWRAGGAEIATWRTPSGGMITLRSILLNGTTEPPAFTAGIGRELRGEGTIVVCPPTPGYVLVGYEPGWTADDRAAYLRERW